MGGRCSCYEEDKTTEIGFTKQIHKAINEASYREQETREDIRIVTVEYASLAAINPNLAINLVFQSLSRGYVARSIVKDKINKKTTAIYLQSISRGYLSRKCFNVLTRERLFGRFEFIEETIDEKTSKEVLDVEQKLEQIIPLERIKKEQRLVLLKKGSYYQGEWNDNKEKHGYGILIEKNKSRYTGSFKNNLKEGKGRIIWYNGDYYEGEFASNFINGDGTIHTNDGSQIHARFVNGEIKGNAKEI